MTMIHAVPIVMTTYTNFYTGQTYESGPAVEPTQEQLDIYKDWCKKNVGTNNWNYGFHKNVPYEFRFKNSEDLLAFKLTFGL